MIGFGETEVKFEEKLEENIRDHVLAEYAKRGDCYFTDGFVSEIRQWVDTLAKKSRDASDGHKSADNYPDRYSYFWATTIADASHVVILLSFHHINRRHAFSPDGWALMQSKRLFHVDEFEASRLKEAA